MSDGPFDYRKPTDEQVAAMTAVNVHFRAAYDELLRVTGGSAERTLSIRKLQEARMWPNVAILGVGL